MHSELIVALAVTVPLGWAGFVFTLWKWDARRYERSAKEELKASEERAKEREHELKLAATEIDKAHQSELSQMRQRVDQQEATLLRVQHTITMRLLKALNDSTTAEQELKQTVMSNFEDLSQKTTQGFEGMRTDYAMLLQKIGDIAEQNTGVSRLLQEFSEDVANYYEKLQASLQNEKDKDCVESPQPTPAPG